MLGSEEKKVLTQIRRKHLSCLQRTRAGRRNSAGVKSRGRVWLKLGHKRGVEGRGGQLLGGEDIAESGG